MKKIGAAALCAAFLLLPVFSGCAPESVKAERGRLPEELKAGDVVKFGRFEQDNDPKNGAEDIEWQVLSVEDGTALLISRYGLDCKPYNREYREVTWESCTLREWLNGEFYGEAFSDEEKSEIVRSDVPADVNPKYGTDSGNGTTDRVFLLSIAETEKYFAADGSVSLEDKTKCRVTKYAKQKGAYVGDCGNSWWWLRSPGGGQSSAANVFDEGGVNSLGYYVSNGFYAVRPALRVKPADRSAHGLSE